ncbi:MAG: 30S ribosomal protein S12 methylthiotransferase RimO, partial [Simkania negevensis]|nr:30S ribosomal protein S12 methylthiotransferase RimO [Simkania negevensis]
GTEITGRRRAAESTWSEADLAPSPTRRRECKEARGGGRPTSARSFLQEGEVPRQLSTPSHYAYLKIAEGCRKRCSYCIIPKIKGPLKSKSIKQVLREFQVLRKNGVSEIILIAQDLGDFGKDVGFKKNKGLIALLEEILKEEGNFWLRFLYLYPDEIDDEMIALMKRDSRICPYLDLPIQHINNEILKAMHRKTSREEIISIITRLRKEIPEISIRTSLIVGFPGETEKEFEELVDFVKEYPLDQVGIFAYSREKESHSYSLLGQVEEEVKQKRREKLAKVQQAVLKKHLKKKIGQKLEVVVEGYHLESPFLMRGRHQGQCPEIDGEVIINDGRKVDAFGKKYLVEITDVSGYDLVGKVIKRIV